MAIYDYKAGKKRVESILVNELKVIEQNKVPSDDVFTFNNGYYSWVTSIFVDIRDSTTLFANNDKENTSKIIKSFTSEVIEILRDDDNLREIGIRGDCVYAVYTSPNAADVFELANKAFYINTYMKMLNKLLLNYSLHAISVGIGMSTAQELVVKAGRKDVGINSKVWIGDAVTKASKLSSLGNKDGIQPLVFSGFSYFFIIDMLAAEQVGKDPKSWFTQHYDNNFGLYYDSNIIFIEFDKWVSEGMQD
ncbi:MAG: adenylate/guanylate cyclase domain-containing protein [Oscillospiraceae bacterium]